MMQDYSNHNLHRKGYNNLMKALIDERISISHYAVEILMHKGNVGTVLKSFLGHSGCQIEVNVAKT
jgi:hypothetical protein